MAEFKFSCPRCGQHIQCDPGYSGSQINCPSCQQAIVVPQAPHSAAAPSAPLVPPPTSPAPSAKFSNAVPVTGRRFAGAPSLTGAPPPKPKSKALKTVLIIIASVAVLAGLGVGGWIGFGKYKEHKAAQAAKKENPAAQVTAPTSTATMGALGILSKVHAAYTNLATVSAEDSVTLFLDLSNLTLADVNPDSHANAKTADRHPRGMPQIITNTTEISVKSARSNLYYYFAGEAVSKVDRQMITNTFAFWSSDKGRFTFSDSHLKGVRANYMQFPDIDPANNPAEQFKNLQHLFDDPAQLAKIIKDLGQTDDEPVNGQDCYTLTAKVLGQKVKIWVDKTSYLIQQWQLTLGGAISDADIDDAFSLVAAGFTNAPPQQLDMVKVQVKKYTPAMTKIRGTITSTSKNIEVNPALSAADFDYPVPPGVRLVRIPNPRATTRRAN